MNSFTEDDLVELSLLRGFEIDELVAQDLLPVEQRFEDSALHILYFSYPDIKLQLHTGHTYPAEQLNFEIENLALPRLSFDPLRTELRRIISDDAAVNSYEKWAEREDGVAFEFRMTALHLVQKTVDYLADLTKSDALDEQPQAKYKNQSIPDLGIDIKGIQANSCASKVLGKTLEQICSEIPLGFRVLHVESVIRNDLYSNFNKCKARIRERIYDNLSFEELRRCTLRTFAKQRGHERSERSELIEHLVTPRLTFHGTPNSRVPSIVRNGFLRAGDFNPGTGDYLKARCGNTYGRGVYSSPSAEFSLMYSGEDARPTKPDGFWGLKLIVCATIMGVAREMFCADNWRTQNEPYPGADSHVANNELEYIVFDCAQILPCYVIHLDWGEDNRKYFDDIPADPKQWKAKKHPKLASQVLAPGDKQRAKEALTEKAAKYFPYGYGPATGTSFVVEDVGEVDEDEEEYGDYQKDRIDGVDDESGTVWDWGVNELRRDVRDEYTDALRGKTKRFKNTAAT